MSKISRPKNSRRGSSAFKSQSSNRRGSMENLLAGILRDLAKVLVSNGYGISGLNRLAKRAYFEAALDLDLAAGRKNHARIAAATGLTRAEVSRMSRESVDIAVTAPVNRAQRICMAWTSDRAYSNPAGNPSVLPFSGKVGSFERLVKDYSGDIPVRAMFSEMRRLKMVRRDISNNVQLVRSWIPVSRQTTVSLRALSQWVSFLSPASENELAELNANSIEVALNFQTMPELFAAVRELQRRASAFVDGIHELDGGKKARPSFKLEVSLALATRVPSLDCHPKKLQG